MDVQWAVLLARLLLTCACMEVIEEQAIRDATSPPKVCFSILKKTNISCFHDILNSIDPHIDFTRQKDRFPRHINF